MYLLEIVVIV